jgi:hypothetical protein
MSPASSHNATFRNPFLTRPAIGSGRWRVPHVPRVDRLKNPPTQPGGFFPSVSKLTIRESFD